jgi:hypothetical protein
MRLRRAALLHACFTKLYFRAALTYCLFCLTLLQCPFIDEYILVLHNKIRSKSVEFPDS